MEDNDILKSRISDKLKELYTKDLSFSPTLVIEGGYDQIEAVSKKLRSERRLLVWIYLPFACLLVSLVMIASILQVFDYQIFKWDKAGLTIMFSLTFLMNAWRTKCTIERLKMMQFLIELKNEIE